MKYCPCCKTSKETTEFYKAGNRHDGLDCYCKECMKIKRAHRKINNAGSSVFKPAKRKTKLLRRVGEPVVHALEELEKNQQSYSDQCDIAESGIFIGDAA